jgi:hypothetical protein
VQRRLREDPEYRAAREREDAERARRIAEDLAASAPVLADLRTVGLDVASVWDLYKFPDQLPGAIPVLLDHLQRNYPDLVLEGIATGLQSKAARPAWAPMKHLYLTTTNDVVRDRLAAALSQCAVKAHYHDLLTFVHDERLGSSRIYFLRPINRIGNRMRPGMGRAVVEALAKDPAVAGEAEAILAGKGVND